MICCFSAIMVSFLKDETIIALKQKLKLNIMKNSTIFSALVMSTMFFLNLNQAQAQRVWCQFDTRAFVVAPDPSLGEELHFTTEAELLWIKMDPASRHNKSDEDGGCFLEPHKHKFIAVNGIPKKIPYCNNSIVEYKKVRAERSDSIVTTTPKGAKVTTTTVTPTSIVVNNNIVTGGGNGSSGSSRDHLNEYKDGLVMGKGLYADGVDKGLEAAERVSRIAIDRTNAEADARIREKQADAMVAIATKNSNGSGNCCGGGNSSSSSSWNGYSTAPQPQVIQMQQQPQQRRGGNGAAIGGLVVGGVNLAYNVLSDFFGVNGRFRPQSRGVTTVNNNTWNTSGGGWGTDPGTDPFVRPGIDPF